MSALAPPRAISGIVRPIIVGVPGPNRAESLREPKGNPWNLNRIMPAEGTTS